MSVHDKKRGFTVIELIVSISIFVLMTSLLITNYSKFDSQILLSNLAYDVALAVRTAQTYGISVQGQIKDSSGFKYNYAYGVAFCRLQKSASSPMSSGCYDNNSALSWFGNNEIVLFTDINNNKVFDKDDTRMSVYSIKRGAKVSNLCFTSGGGETCNKSRMDITFLRPNPDAMLCAGDGANPSSCTNADLKQEVRIEVESSEGARRNVVVNKTGQVSVQN